MEQKISVLIQTSHPPKLSKVLTFDINYVTEESDSLLNIPGFSIDKDYQPVKLGSISNRFEKKQPSYTLDVQSPQNISYVVRGKLENEAALKALIQRVEQGSKNISVFSDPRINIFNFSSQNPIGTHNDVANLLEVSRLHKQGMNGSGVFVAVVDTGFNLSYLNRKGKNPNFNQPKSWAVENLIAGNVPIEPGTSHGTMCAFNVCLTAPQCTLIDYAVIPKNRKGDPLLEGFLSDVLKAYGLLAEWLLGFEAEGKTKPVLVINNSWGLYHPSWDYPIEDSRRYLDNPNHPFNIAIQDLEDAGVDILFAAGNCGDSTCLDCKEVTGKKTIYGANSHPKVLCVSGVTVNKEYLGYSSQGPGYLEDKKPDLCAYADFSGSGVNDTNIDRGTSTACAVATGVVAAIRTVYPPGKLPPTQLRQLLCDTAEKLSLVDKFDYKYGYGLINVNALLKALEQMNIQPQPIATNTNMTQEDFQQIVKQEPEVLRSLQRVAISANQSPTMDFGVSEVILLSIVIPMTSYLIREIGLPWLYEAKRYSELWRLKLDTWIDQQYEKAGIDKEQAKIAGEGLRQELESTQDHSSWERVYNLLKGDSDNN